MLECFTIIYKDYRGRVGAKSQDEAVERFIAMYEKYEKKPVEVDKLEIIPLGRSKH